MKNVLADTYLSNPKYKENEEENINIESGIEVEYIDVEADEWTEVLEEDVQSVSASID